MVFDLPAFDETRTLLLAALSGRFPNANLSQRAQLYKLASVWALGLTDAHFHIHQVGEELLPDNDEGAAKWGPIKGVTLKAATGSTGTAALRVFGDVGATVPNSEPLTHAPSGLFFETRSGGTIPAVGYLDVNVAATSVGELTNLEVGQELQFQTTPTNLEQTARIVVELSEGRDQELPDAYTQRVLDNFAQPPEGGNDNDYVQWALASQAYVASAYAYPNRNGTGTVDVVALKSGSGSQRLLDAGERAAVLAYITPKRPSGAQVRVLETLEEQTDVEAEITPESDPSFAFDWNDSTPPTILGYTSATRTLQFNAARPADMTVGDRLQLDIAGSTGAEVVIEALSSTDSVVLEDDLPVAPAGGENVYSGGPLVAPLRAAVLALFDSLGPANPDGSAYPSWEGNLRLATLFETIQTTDGVLDSEIADPAANVVATDYVFPDTAQVGLITPGKLIFRRKH